MRIVTVRQAARCVVCHDTLDAVVLQAVCPACDARGHVDCLSSLRGCPTLGCARRAAVVPATVVVSWPTEARPRFGRIAVAMLSCLAVAGAFVTPGVMGQGHRARVQRVQADMRALGDTVQRFRADCGAYPASLDALGPNLKEYPPTDPWGNEYLYHYEGGGRFLILSLGADGARGGEDESQDLSSRDL